MNSRTHVPLKEVYSTPTAERRDAQDVFDDAGVALALKPKLTPDALYL